MELDLIEKYPLLFPVDDEEDAEEEEEEDDEEWEDGPKERKFVAC